MIHSRIATVAGVTIATAGTIGYLQLKSDPEGTARRPPESMHARQASWPAKCRGDGEALQSPIAISSQHFAQTGVTPISLKTGVAPADLIDVGHTFQLRYDAAAPGGWVEFEGKTFELRQFHFHKPSEHVIDGKQFEMEAHFVFLPKDEGQLPRAVVLGFPIDEGEVNAEIGKMWKGLPPFREGYGETDATGAEWTKAVATSELELDSMDHQENVLSSQRPIDLAELLPSDTRFFVYDGSLTTPPCDEGITHAVSLIPMRLSHDQIEHFEGYYEGSNRDLQPIGDVKTRKFRRAVLTSQTAP